MLYLGHVSVWFFIILLLLISKIVKLKKGNALIACLVFGMIFAVPSCTIQLVFGG